MEPVVIKSLKVLRDSRKPLSLEELSSMTGEDPLWVEKALEKLSERKVVVKEGSLYHYDRTPANEEFSRKFFILCEKAINRPKIEFLVRGILSSGVYLAPGGRLRIRNVFVGGYEYEPYLFHLGTLRKILEDEGFSSSETDSFIEEEMDSGFVGKVEFYLGSKEEPEFSAPPYIGIFHQYVSVIRKFGAFLSSKQDFKEWELFMVYYGKPSPHLSPFFSTRRMTPEEVEEFKKETMERWESFGWHIRKEEYLFGQYPPELLKPAIEYIDRERPEIKKRLSDEISKFW
ncbi:MAG: hypothetical protein NZ583_02395 [Desulfobacterota bacterium]|nr:hypothetical protein [Thermodesulfobacteriota bacterium]MDW8001735.1 hypothetical protein [Deltaproteobacteria bacterium]